MAWNIKDGILLSIIVLHIKINSRTISSSVTLVFGAFLFLSDGANQWDDDGGGGQLRRWGICVWIEAGGSG